MQGMISGFMWVFVIVEVISSNTVSASSKCGGKQARRHGTQVFEDQTMREVKGTLDSGQRSLQEAPTQLEQETDRLRDVFSKMPSGLGWSFKI